MPDTRKLILSFSVLLFLIPSSLRAMGTSQGEDRPSKPGSPVSVSIAALDGRNPMPGDVSDLLVTVSSSISSDKFEVKLKLSGGAQLIGESPDWGLSIDKGVTISRVITVRFPGHPGGRVSVRASLMERGKGGGRYSGRASLSVPARSDGNQGELPPGRATKDGSGRPIMEYKGQ